MTNSGRPQRPLSLRTLFQNCLVTRARVVLTESVSTTSHGVRVWCSISTNVTTLACNVDQHHRGEHVPRSGCDDARCQRDCEASSVKVHRCANSACAADGVKRASCADDLSHMRRIHMPLKHDRAHNDESKGVTNAVLPLTQYMPLVRKFYLRR